MLKKVKLLILLFVISSILFVLLSSNKNNNNSAVENTTLIPGEFNESKVKSEDEWKKLLSPQQYEILRNAGTEHFFTGDLLNEKRIGTYYSVGCNQPVFRSEKKYESGTGWPSFWNPISEDALILKDDYKLGYKRVEILDKCGGHLGHVFDDGPHPTGKRYCINSIALYFIPDK